MANSTIFNRLTKHYYSETALGMPGCSAVKTGNIVQLNFAFLTPISGTAGGWKTIATLPEELKPYIGLSFSACDNNATSLAGNIPYQMRISPDGKINIWIFSDKTSNMRPVGYVTYVAK